MGLGDEIMACGEARRLRAEHDKLCRPIRKKGRPYWNPVFQFCPDMGRGGRRPLQNLYCGVGCRPYIDYEHSTPERWAWVDYTPTPARLHYPPPRKKHGRILIEPNTKERAPVGKQWGWDNWLALSKHFDFVQIGPIGTKHLPGVEFIPTQSLADMLRVVAGCSAAVVPEGGLHHALAAFGKPAVVLYGAYITPHQTGYDGHAQLWVDDPDAQGWRIPNEAQTAAWQLITPDLVANELEKLLDDSARGCIPTGRREALNRDDESQGQAVRPFAGWQSQLPAAQIPPCDAACAGSAGLR